jgi:hypothetical protein
MSDFCQQCSVDLFGQDCRDMAGLSTQEDTRQGLFAVVLCEGCGPCQVDHEGRCIGGYCFGEYGTHKAHFWVPIERQLTAGAVT